MLKKLLMLTGVCFCLSAAAQKTVYRSYNYMGVLEGESKTGYQVLTTHGLQLGSYFVGLGTGFDTYKEWSIPVFVSASKYLFRGKNDFFLNANAGTVFVPKHKTVNWQGTINSEIKPGLFGEMGLAYRLKSHAMKSGQGVLFGMYYSYKAYKEKVTTPTFCINPPCLNEYETINYYLHRWAFKVGFVL
ncbi:MAG: hypothetical protein ACTHMV_09130 [Chitinophagaceae bacterium]